MAVKIVPETKTRVCDCCGCVCDQHNYRTQSYLQFHKAGLDYQGCAVGPAGFALDLCDKCSDDIESMIRKYCKSESDKRLAKDK